MDAARILHLPHDDHKRDFDAARQDVVAADRRVTASHGRSGMRAFLPGSETQKVLTHSQIPVLVVRQSTLDNR
jgi:nucleotide-binding universal stress UspA family protein